MTKNLSQDSQSQDLNPHPTKQEAGMLTIQLQYLVKLERQFQ
jgi:hypothetical protein